MNAIGVDFVLVTDVVLSYASYEIDLCSNEYTGYAICKERVKVS